MFVHNCRALEENLGNIEVENSSLGLVRVARRHRLREGPAAILDLVIG